MSCVFLLFQGTEGVNQVKVYIDEGAATIEVKATFLFSI
jgi:hypothetical protein